MDSPPRIYVNDELGELARGLAAAEQLLKPGGRLAVVSFHSLEDRMVKHMRHDAADAGLGTLSPKKPIVPRRTEVLANRRSRSAKLRVFERSLIRAEQVDAPAAFFSYA